MAAKAQIILGGEGAYEELLDIAQNGGTKGSWSCGKNTKAGERLLIYAIQPSSAIVAIATAATNARPHKQWHFVAGIKNVTIIGKPIPRQEMLDRFPKWGWPKQPRKPTYPHETVARELLRLAKRKGKPINESIITLGPHGAGFGTPEHNREVERAACSAVRQYFESKGYKVESREREKIGYDFDAYRKGEELHIEVKGMSGLGWRFPITAKERGCAESDSKFCVAVVTQAVSAEKRIHIISRANFLKHFDFRALAFMATAKSSLPI